MDKDAAEFLFDIEYYGFSIFEAVVPDDLLIRLRADMEAHLQDCAKWQKKNGLTTGFSNTAHHTLGADDSFDEFLTHHYLDEYVSLYFQGLYILNGYHAFDNVSQSDAYEHAFRFHRDVRTFSKESRLLLNMVVMVDDFTVENGATKVVPGSHRIKDRPSDDYFERHAVRATGCAGSIILFDSNLWHSAAANTTGRSRKILTLTFSRPFFKQQLDYPRMLGEAYPKDEKMRQLLGYNSRVPSNRDEWFQPPEKFFYKNGQG